MRNEEIRKVLERRIKFDEKSIEYDRSFLRYTNKEIKRERKRCKEVYQYILDKPDKEWWDLEHISAGKYVSSKLDNLYKERQGYYRSIKKSLKSIDDARKLIEKYC